MTVTLDDVISIFRPLNPAESSRAMALIPLVEDEIRQRAYNVGKDIDRMMLSGELFPNVFKSVVVDIVGRMLLTPTDEAPMSQMSQSALGYSVSGTYLVPGGGLYIKKSELERLGLKRQRVGVLDVFGTSRGNCPACGSDCDRDG